MFDVFGSASDGFVGKRCPSVVLVCIHSCTYTESNGKTSAFSLFKKIETTNTFLNVSFEVFACSRIGQL